MTDTDLAPVQPEVEVVTEIVRTDPQPGVYALAALSDEQFKARLNAMLKVRDRVAEIQRSLMRPEVHYWKPPGGQDRPPSLTKAGAEVLCKLYNFVCIPHFEVRYGDPDNLTSPAVQVSAHVDVHAGAKDGPVVGSGVGSANTWETKHRYRNAQRLCPDCEKPTIILSKWPEKGGELQGLKPWVCLEKSGGCGHRFHPDEPKLTQQRLGRVPNPDAHDLENTIVKMAVKRAKVDATIAATHTSDLFTQDLEETGNKDSPTENEGAAPRQTSRGAKGRPAAPSPIREDDLTIARRQCFAVLKQLAEMCKYTLGRGDSWSGPVVPEAVLDNTFAAEALRHLLMGDGQFDRNSAADTRKFYEHLCQLRDKNTPPGDNTDLGPAA